jgi:hypothetical protein
MFAAALLVAVTQIPALLKQNEIIANPILQPEDDNFFTFVYYYISPIITNISYLILSGSVVLNIAFYRQLKRTSSQKQTVA